MISTAPPTAKVIDVIEFMLYNEKYSKQEAIMKTEQIINRASSAQTTAPKPMVSTSTSTFTFTSTLTSTSTFTPALTLSSTRLP